MSKQESNYVWGEKKTKQADFLYFKKQKVWAWGGRITLPWQSQVTTVSACRNESWQLSLPRMNMGIFTTPPEIAAQAFPSEQAPWKSSSPTGIIGAAGTHFHSVNSGVFSRRQSHGQRQYGSARILAHLHTLTVPIQSSLWGSTLSRRTLRACL